MAMKLGMFTMPFHHPARDYTTILEEDQDAIVLAEQLGFSEVFVGEHFSSWSERITSPLIFLASLASRTRQITFGTGVINLPQLHPATVAAHAAMFDHHLRGHWEKYVEGCEAAGRRPDPGIWRVSRSVLVTESDAEAEDYLADPENGLSFYYTFFHFSFSQLRKALFMVKPDLEMPDEAVTVDTVKRGMIIAGSPARVLEQLVALREETGPFGTLLRAG